MKQGHDASSYSKQFAMMDQIGGEMRKAQQARIDHMEKIVNPAISRSMRY